MTTRFDPADAAAVLRRTPGTLLLDRFEEAREANLAELASLLDGGLDLDRAGVHSELGRVTARQLLATWVEGTSADAASRA